MLQCFRLINNIQTNRVKRFGLFSIEELEFAKILELRILQSGNFLESKNWLSSLTPFLDEKGVIRGGGRLKATDSPF